MSDGWLQCRIGDLLHTNTRKELKGRQTAGRVIVFPHVRSVEMQGSRFFYFPCQRA